MTISVALFACPHCIDEFAFDHQKIAKLNYGWRVRVRCPGCGNVVEVVMLNYTLIHGCDPDKYKPGEIVEILRPEGLKVACTSAQEKSGVQFLVDESRVSEARLARERVPR